MPFLPILPGAEPEPVTTAQAVARAPNWYTLQITQAQAASVPGAVGPTAVGGGSVAQCSAYSCPLPCAAARLADTVACSHRHSNSTVQKRPGLMQVVILQEDA